MAKTVKMNYSDYIRKDTNPKYEKEILLNLYYLTKFYHERKIYNNQMKEPTENFSTYNFTTRRKLNLLKIALLDNSPKIELFPLDNSFFYLKNYIFVVAMLKEKEEIIQHFLSYGFPKNINSPIFGCDMLPTFFHLGCIGGFGVMGLITEYSPKYNITWNGLTPQMIAINKRYCMYEKQEWTFITSYQYQLLNMLRNVKLPNTKKAPIFLLDLLCANNRVIELKQLLEETPELINVSEYCYVFCQKFLVLKILSRYTINVYQSYGSTTPLHTASYVNDLNMVTTYIFLKMNCNIQDHNGDTPLHIAARRKFYFVLELLIRSGGDVNIVNNKNESVKDIYEADKWVMKSPNYRDHEIVSNLADMDRNYENFECSSVALSHIANLKPITSSRFRVFSLLKFYNKENEARNMIFRLKNSDDYTYVHYSDVHRKFLSVLFKK